jgi:hypothetical protein
VFAVFDGEEIDGDAIADRGVRASPGCRSVATWRAACRRSSITYSPSTRPPTPRRRIGRSPPALLLGPRMDSYSTDTLEAFQAWTAAD